MGSPKVSRPRKTHMEVECTTGLAETKKRVVEVVEHQLMEPGK